MALHVFLNAGQSNNTTGKGLVPALDGNGGGVFQIGRHGADAGRLISGAEPLHHNEVLDPGETHPRPNSIGYATTFARLYFAKFGHRVLLAPAARGGTGFSFSGANLAISWNRATGGLYQEAVATANAAMALVPGAVFKGILWSQGGANSNLTEVQYAPLLDDTLHGFRADITGASADTPILLGGMVKAWADANAVEIRNAQINTPNRVAMTAYVDPTQPFNLDRTQDNDLIHLDAWEQRVMGARYFNAYQMLLAGA